MENENKWVSWSEAHGWFCDIEGFCEKTHRFDTFNEIDRVFQKMCRNETTPTQAVQAGKRIWKRRVDSKAFFDTI